MADESPLTRDAAPWLLDWAQAQRRRPMQQPLVTLAAQPSTPPPERIQRMIHVLLENQQIICQYPSGTLVFQFAKNEVQAKVTYTLPS